jgi:hypothetical protein
MGRPGAVALAGSYQVSGSRRIRVAMLAGSQQVLRTCSLVLETLAVRLQRSRALVRGET